MKIYILIKYFDDTFEKIEGFFSKNDAVIAKKEYEKKDRKNGNYWAYDIFDVDVK